MSTSSTNQAEHQSGARQNGHASQSAATGEGADQNRIILRADHLSCMDHREAAHVLNSGAPQPNDSGLNGIGNQLLDTFDAAETLTSSNRKETPSTVSIALSITEAMLLCAGHFEIADDIAAEYPHGADRHRSQASELLHAILDQVEDFDGCPLAEWGGFIAAERGWITLGPHTAMGLEDDVHKGAE